MNPLLLEALTLAMFTVTDVIMWTRVARTPASAERTGHIIAAVTGVIGIAIMAMFFILTWREV